MLCLLLSTVRVRFSTWLGFPNGGGIVVDDSRSGSYIVDVEVFFGDIDLFVWYIRYFDIFVLQLVVRGEES